MIRKFLMLEWKSFIRSASFATNLAIKILLGLGALYIIGIALLLGVGGYYILEESGLEPVTAVSRFAIYYFVVDLLFRLMLQKLPVMNIRPLLTLPISRATIVNFSLGKTCLSFFNLWHFFLLIPFTVVMFMEGHSPLSVGTWFLSMAAMVFINNFLNLLLNNKDNLFYLFMVVTAALAAAQYYDYFDVTLYTVGFYYGFFENVWMVLLAFAVLVALYILTFNFFRHHLYLDVGLAGKHTIAETENFTWLNRYGTLGTFLKNDIKLIKRNKRSKSSVIMSAVFILYGFLFFTDAIEVYNNPIMHMFAGIFVTGGFLFTFGQFVPSWDSSYYPLMMTQNIPYRGYLTSKWWLIVIATCFSAIVSCFYLIFGWEIYLMILAGAIYNIGVNSHLVLLGGAYTKTPIDLASAKAAFGDKKAFNIKTLLLSIPKLLLPMLLYGAGYYLISPAAGMIFVVIAGIIGFVLRDRVFTWIERVYKTEKYSTLDAYKQKS